MDEGGGKVMVCVCGRKLENYMVEIGERGEKFL